MNVGEKWRNRQWGGKAWGLSGAGRGVPGRAGGGLEAHHSAGGLPVLPAPSPARGARVCLQRGRASLPAAAAPAVLAGGAYATAVAAARSSASTLQVPPVNPGLCAVVATFSVCA